jgi:hypothetical protein
MRYFTTATTQSQEHIPVCLKTQGRDMFDEMTRKASVMTIAATVLYVGAHAMFFIWCA